MGYGGYVSYRGFTAGQITQLYNGIGMSYSSATRPVEPGFMTGWS